MEKYLHKIKHGQKFSGKIEKINNDAIKIFMHEGSVLRIEGGKGIELLCASGLLWMTQENEIKDYFLAAGDEFQISRSGLVILQALTDCCNVFVHLNNNA